MSECGHVGPEGRTCELAPGHAGGHVRHCTADDFPPDATFERTPATHFAYGWLDEPDDYRRLVVMPPVIATPAPQTDGAVSENTGGDNAPFPSEPDLAPAS